MSFEVVYLVSDKLILPSGEELDALESRLASPLPRGYRNYMTTLGVGTFCDLVWIFPPTKVREALGERREFVREYYDECWGGNESVLTFEEAARGVPFARTMDGDEYIYCRGKGSRLFILPRHDDAVYWLELGFDDPLDWTSQKGRGDYVFQPPFRYFEPGGPDRRIIEFFTAGAFEMRELSRHFRARWSGQEVPWIPDQYSVLLFPKAIGGRIQLTQGPDDARVRIRVDYDSDYSGEVERLAGELRHMGFYETWRHPSGTATSYPPR